MTAERPTNTGNQLVPELRALRRDKDESAIDFYSRVGTLASVYQTDVIGIADFPYVEEKFKDWSLGEHTIAERSLVMARRGLNGGDAKSLGLLQLQVPQQRSVKAEGDSLFMFVSALRGRDVMAMAGAEIILHRSGYAQSQGFYADLAYQILGALSEPPPLVPIEAETGTVQPEAVLA